MKKLNPKPVRVETKRRRAIMTRSAPGAGAKRSGPPDANQSRAATVAPGSYDAETRTFGVVLSSFADVKRYGMIERLSSDPADWDLSRVALGQCKFLDSHNQAAVGAVLGTLTEARFENGQLVGRVQLAESDAARAAEVDIASGHLKGVSIGYSVGAWALVESGDADTWRASQITLLEASLVSVPADAGAMIRSADEGDAAQPVNRRREWSFAEGEKLIERARFFGDWAAPIAREMMGRGFADAEIIAAIKEEGQRREGLPGSGLSVKDIRDIQRIADMSNQRALADGLIDQGDLSRAEIFQRLTYDAGARQEASTGHLRGPAIAVNYEHERAEGGRSTMSYARNDETLDNPDFVRRSLESALYARMTGKAPEGVARQFVGARLEDYETILAELRGDRRSWLDRGPGRWFGGGSRGHTTSDFPNLLLGAGNRVLQDGYQGAMSPLAMLSRERLSADFRPVNTLRLSEAPALEKVLENGEVKYGSRGEEAEAFKVETFAKIFSLSRQAYTNDDLGAFADTLQAFARASAETVANQLVALFIANTGNGVNLSDGNALFTTGRGNKASAGTAISVATLGEARKALRETKGLDGKTPIGLTPRYLVVGPAKETEAELAISAVMANQTSNANPFAGKLEVLVEPRFTGNAWRLFADPAQQAVISHAYLNGRGGPSLETREGWTTLGAEFRAVLDFGCGATDWRGAYLNPGA